MSKKSKLVRVKDYVEKKKKEKRKGRGNFGKGRFELNFC